MFQKLVTKTWASWKAEAHHTLPNYQSCLHLLNTYKTHSLPNAHTRILKHKNTFIFISMSALLQMDWQCKENVQAQSSMEMFTAFSDITTCHAITSHLVFRKQELSELDHKHKIQDDLRAIMNMWHMGYCLILSYCGFWIHRHNFHNFSLNN